MNNHSTLSQAYQKALDAHNVACGVFRAAQTAYRARTIGDAEFMAARKAYDAATAVYDEAFTLESAND